MSAAPAAIFATVVVLLTVAYVVPQSTPAIACTSNRSYFSLPGSVSRQSGCGFAAPGSVPSPDCNRSALARRLVISLIGRGLADPLARPEGRNGV